MSIRRCDWEYNAAVYKAMGHRRNTRWGYMNAFRSNAAMYKPCQRIHDACYERRRLRGIAGLYNGMFFSNHKPYMTGTGIHRNDWWHR